MLYLRLHCKIVTPKLFSAIAAVWIIKHIKFLQESTKRQRFKSSVICKKIDLKKWNISLEFKEIITVLTLTYMECVFGTSITQKSQKAKIPRTTPFPCKKTFDTIILPEMDRIQKTLWILFQFGSAPKTGTDFTIFCKFCPLQVKLRYHILSSIKTHGIWALWHFPSWLRKI